MKKAEILISVAGGTESVGSWNAREEGFSLLGSKLGTERLLPDLQEELGKTWAQKPGCSALRTQQDVRSGDNEHRL